MILLSFTVRNHKSIRDEVTLDLITSELKTLTPKDGDWASVSYPLAGIFGGNATGKSGVLDALRYMVTAIEDSSTSWQAAKRMRRAPFLLDGTSKTSSSTYELDLVHEGRRYQYGFEVDAQGIKSEWLRDIPTSRWRILLDRDRSAEEARLHPSVRPALEVSPRELVLSRALVLPTSPLHAIAKQITTRFDAVLVKDSHREARLRDLTDSLVEKSITFDELELLLQVADIGVTKVAIKEHNLPMALMQAVARFRREAAAATGDDATHSDEAEEDLDEEQKEEVVRQLVFTHRGTTDDCPPFSIQDESDGTIAWLAMAVPALKTLREGGVLLVDEIDASLHPHLVDLLLHAFSDSEVNTQHAQLIFTSHESYLLTPLSEVALAPEQVWFTDKTNEGVTQLSCLDDFPKHPDANVAKRYLTGRYGGTPRLSPSTLDALVNTTMYTSNGDDADA